RKHNYNFFELLIMLCFIMGMGMLILAFFSIIEGLSGTPLMPLAGPILVLYCVWAIGQFFNQHKVSTYLKALAAYLLGMITFTVLAGLLGYMIDVIFKPVLGA